MQGILGELRFFTDQKRERLKDFWGIMASSTDADVFPFDSFPPIKHFTTLVDEEKNATQEMEKNKKADQTLVSILSSCSRDKIEQLQNNLIKLQDNINQLTIYPEKWTRKAVEDILSENSTNWKMMAKNMADSLPTLEKYASLADNTIISVPNKDIHILHQDAIILYKHMHNGGNLGWSIFRPTIVKERKDFLDTVRIDGIPCSSEEDFAKVPMCWTFRVKAMPCGRYGILTTQKCWEHMLIRQNFSKDY